TIRYLSATTAMTFNKPSHQCPAIRRHSLSPATEGSAFSTLDSRPWNNSRRRLKRCSRSPGVTIVLTSKKMEVHDEAQLPTKPTMGFAWTGNVLVRGNGRIQPEAQMRFRGW